MEIGIGLDQSLRLSFAESRQLVQEAARLGYASAWTPAGLTPDAFQICSHWSVAGADAVATGIGTGISVVPVGIWSPPSLACVAGTVGEISGGRFVLGIGSGGLHTAEYRQSLGLADAPLITRLREYLTVLRGLLAGEAVDFEGRTLVVHGVRLGFKPPRVPVYLGALGPQMLRLAGEVADGAALNWCTPEQVRWSRERVEAGARRAGRDASAPKLAEYIRVSVDDDPKVARTALARATLSYATARPGVSKETGYRGHFARMGFGDVLDELEERRERGATMDELADATPDELLLGVGYYGTPAEAGKAFRRLGEGLDTAIVRVVPARPGLDAIRAVMSACRPA